ncbi:hypothetical protein LZ30DRAFT_331786 [Colletotrichum cereale]|nr:hypothetical protein LZ30DRAFT_331786 [Colletotrichum cereale]
MRLSSDESSVRHAFNGPHVPLSAVFRITRRRHLAPEKPVGCRFFSRAPCRIKHHATLIGLSLVGQLRRKLFELRAYPRLVVDRLFLVTRISRSASRPRSSVACRLPAGSHFHHLHPFLGSLHLPRCMIPALPDVLCLAGPSVMPITPKTPKLEPYALHIAPWTPPSASS